MSGHILVVEDDAAILEVVELVLSYQGYQVKTATGGQAALDAIRQDLPSLVLLDMRMADLSGWDFAKTLHNEAISLPIIVMSAATDAQKWADQIDAAGCLAKPFDVNDLIKVVQTHYATSIET